MVMSTLACLALAIYAVTTSSLFAAYAVIAISFIFLFIMLRRLVKSLNALRESEEKYAEAIDASVNAMIISPPYNEITENNDAPLSNTGGTRVKVNGYAPGQLEVREDNKETD